MTRYIRQVRWFSVPRDEVSKDTQDLCESLRENDGLDVKPSIFLSMQNNWKIMPKLTVGQSRLKFVSVNSPSGSGEGPGGPF
jgi:hypothetical protein